jgi:hypothetical protein
MSVANLSKKSHHHLGGLFLPGGFLKRSMIYLYQVIESLKKSYIGAEFFSVFFNDLFCSFWYCQRECAWFSVATAFVRITDIANNAFLGVGLVAF